MTGRSYTAVTKQGENDTLGNTELENEHSDEVVEAVSSSVVGLLREFLENSKVNCFSILHRDFGSPALICCFAQFITAFLAEKHGSWRPIVLARWFMAVLIAFM